MVPKDAAAECPICYEAFADTRCVRSTCCDNDFHRSCAARWRKSCPMCRSARQFQDLERVDGLTPDRYHDTSDSDSDTSDDGMTDDEGWPESVSEAPVRQTPPVTQTPVLAGPRRTRVSGFVRLGSLQVDIGRMYYNPTFAASPWDRTGGTAYLRTAYTESQQRNIIDRNFRRLPPIVRPYPLTLDRPRAGTGA